MRLVKKKWGVVEGIDLDAVRADGECNEWEWYAALAVLGIIDPKTTPVDEDGTQRRA
jgi:hypothetical protein